MSGYHVALEGRPQGPLSRAEVIAMIARGAVEADTLVWRSGMAEWAAASSFVEFAGHFAARAADKAPPVSQPQTRPAPSAPPRAASARRLDIGRAVEDGIAAFRRAPGRSCAGAALYVLTVVAANSALFARFLAPGAGEQGAVRGGGESGAGESGAGIPGAGNPGAGNPGAGDPLAAPPAMVELLPWLVGLLVVAVVLRAGFCLFTLRVLRGEAASPALVFAGLARLPALVPFALLYGASVFGGMMLLVVPGIFVAVAFSLGFYIMMESRLGAVAAMRGSWRAVMALGWWPVFSVYLVSFLGIIALTLLSGAVGFLLGAPLAAQVVQLLLVACWAAVTALVIAAVYEQARRNEGGA